MLDSPNDVMRVFQIIGGPQNAEWFWTISRRGVNYRDDDGRRVNRDGFCATKAEAQAAAEEAYLGEAGR